LLNFEFVILGLYEPSTESIRLETWKAGEPQRKSQSIPVHTCVSGWVWKNQRSFLVHDLDTESKLPVFLESLRQLGVRTYYVFPLTTRHHRLGAIGFGSLTVVPKANPTHELLRRAAAIIAQVLDAAHSDAGLTAETNPIQITSDVLPEPKRALQDFDLGGQSIRDEAFCEIVGNSAPLQELLTEMRTVAATNATVLLLGETGIPSNEDQDRVNGYGLSANSYVRKPVDFAQFIEAIRQPGLYRSHSQLG